MNKEQKPITALKRVNDYVYKFYGGFTGTRPVLTRADAVTLMEEHAKENQQAPGKVNVLEKLRELSPARSLHAFGVGVEDWSLPEWGCALAGEVGELCNFIKKQHLNPEINRTAEIAKEAADIVIYLDLLCARAGIDLQEAIISKFNEVSDKMNCEIKLPTNG